MADKIELTINGQLVVEIEDSDSPVIEIPFTGLVPARATVQMIKDLAND